MFHGSWCLNAALFGKKHLGSDAHYSVNTIGSSICAHDTKVLSRSDAVRSVGHYMSLAPERARNGMSWVDEDTFS